MIVAEAPSALRFITQPAHARLAGQFADGWGGNGLEPPEPREAVIAATYTHDDGWWGFDRQPHLDVDGTPVNFTGLSASSWMALYDRGIDRVVDIDRYAGLLVSLHGSGLRRRRYGLSPSWPDTPSAFRAFVDREEARQRDLLEQLAADGVVSAADEALLAGLHETGTPPAETMSRLWTNYALLQAWDTLSLSFCTTISPPADGTIADVPRRPGGSDATLTIQAVDDDTFAIDPYPFAADPFEVSVSARTVPKAAFETELDLVRAYYAVGLDRLRFRLVSTR